MTQQATGDAVETWVRWQGGRRALLCGDDAPGFTAGLGERAGGRQWRPEELLIGAVELGVMLRFLALAEEEGLQVASYQSSALGRFRGHAEEGCQLIDLIVRPRVSVKRVKDVVHAEALLAGLAQNPPNAGLLRVAPRLQSSVQLRSLAPETALPH